jgi:hypothetical protein
MGGALLFSHGYISHMEIDRFFQIFMQNKMISLPLKLNFLKLKLKVFWYFSTFYAIYNNYIILKK